MFGRKRRAQKEAAAKAKADADLKTAIVDLIGIAEGETSDPEGGPLVLKSGERLVYVMSGGGLFEPRRERGHWSGRSAGFSVPVTDGIRFRVGKSAGTYVQGQEKPTIIDTGDISFTTQRVVFQGGKYTREWLFSKLVGVVHDANQPCTAIQVSNREKTSGIVYAGLSPEIVRLKLEVAVAIFNGDGPDAARELREKLRELDTSTLPTATTAALPSGAQTAAASSGPSSNETHSECRHCCDLRAASGRGAAAGAAPHFDLRAISGRRAAAGAAPYVGTRPHRPPPAALLGRGVLDRLRLRRWA